MNALGPIFTRLTHVSQCSAGAIEDFFLKLHPSPEVGFFVECGAGNGLIQSNTSHLETRYGWSGILIESHQLLFEELVKNRKSERAKLVNATVGAPDECVLFKEIVYDGTPHSMYLGWSSIVDDNCSGAQLKITKSLSDVLKESGAPKVIDLLVLDVESSAPLVVEHFDFSEFDIRMLAVEIKPQGKYCACINRILSHGFNLIHVIPDGPDFIFTKQAP